MVSLFQNSFPSIDTDLRYSFLVVDYCLAHLLRAIILRFIAHPEPHVVLQPVISPIPIEEADTQAFTSLT